MPIGSSAARAQPQSASETPASFFEQRVEVELLPRVARALPDQVTVGFEIDGPGGGRWQVSRGAQGTRVQPLASGPRDCTVRCSSAVFMGIVLGEIDARDAFLDGRLRLAGDIGLALRLQGILSVTD